MIDVELENTFNNLPKTAGVYLFYIKKEIAYIGKAINIKDRVKNHFQQPTYRDHLFISKVTKIDSIKTHSEIEALVLEAQLIKKNLPKFNVVWKDDKNYFFVAFGNRRLTQTGTQTYADKVPYVFITHQPHFAEASRGKATFIGPFVEGVALKKTLKYLRRVFPFYTSAKHPKNKCTWCHLDLCPGPVRNSPPTGPSGAHGAGGVSNGAGPFLNLPEYKKNLKKLALILEGKKKTAFYGLRKEMKDLAKQHKFEEAGLVRDKMRTLQQVMEHTHVIEGSKITDDNWDNTWKIMQKILGINPTPLKLRGTRIECYDISNIQGKFAVGSMVVFKNGVPEKSQYKKFRIQMKNEPNDIAMLKEVLTRRLLHPEWGYPEVMLIDGGIAQLNVAIKVKNKSLTNPTVVRFVRQLKNIKIISIAKGRRELFIEGQKKPIPLKDLPQEIYNLIVHLDDEAHRFAISYHRFLRSKKTMGRNA